MSLGVTLFGLGFIAFAWAAGFALMSYHKTGQLFPGNKVVMIPWVIVSLLASVIGGTIIVLSR